MTSAPSLGTVLDNLDNLYEVKYLNGGSSTKGTWDDYLPRTGKCATLAGPQAGEVRTRHDGSAIMMMPMVLLPREQEASFIDVCHRVTWESIHHLALTRLDPEFVEEQVSEFFEINSLTFNRKLLVGDMGGRVTEDDLIFVADPTDVGVVVRKENRYGFHRRHPYAVVSVGMAARNSLHIYSDLL